MSFLDLAADAYGRPMPDPGHEPPVKVWFIRQGHVVLCIFTKRQAASACCVLSLDYKRPATPLLLRPNEQRSLRVEQVDKEL